MIFSKNKVILKQLNYLFKTIPTCSKNLEDYDI